jgi:DNA-binding response OmpR family regulator
MRLILAEDDRALGSAMRTALGRAGFAADWVQTGRHCRGALTTHNYDCAVIDMGLPDTTGDILLRDIRRQDANLPVMVVTARSGLRERIAMLDQGADDYLVKPFDLDELSARVRSLVRRAPQRSDDEGVLEYGDIHLYPHRQAATWNQRDVKLTQCEYRVLEALVIKKHQILARSQIEESLYAWGQEIESNAVEVYIHYLRRKFYPGLIVTTRGLGYQLAPLHE